MSSSGFHATHAAALDELEEIDQAPVEPSAERVSENETEDNIPCEHDNDVGDNPIRWRCYPGKDRGLNICKPRGADVGWVQHVVAKGCSSHRLEVHRTIGHGDADEKSRQDEQQCLP
eukprot:CAMPEP_0194758298 /NCGR_PEP_ID=MMETSP0323_2-20130528/11607_1 /TAXON_ID=2866 ORGANISM="Crypthecodinium cohnii, Strain Seligo" /NCGR_SAMPLE_ID=MMETSP0323_2 /ASSEMBLY_ACC=CAM_ASM_000346 /LENGTH=116 /DNA_ID=CAMNT_0039678573 /DNA_START=153 /DNA_END=503 /DNA_ORIENTATION=+